MNTRYQDIHYAASDLWKGEQKVMAELAGRVPDGGTIVEIGTWQGGTTRLLYDVTHPRGVHVCTIDVAPQQAAYDRLAGTDVEIMAEHSVDAARKWALSSRELIDLLFIDGSHLFQDVLQDFNAWAFLLNPGGTIVFHDYDPLERGGVVHLGVQVVVDTVRRLNRVKDATHAYKLFYGVPGGPASGSVRAIDCHETFVGLARNIASLWENDYAGWELIADDRLALLLRTCLRLGRSGYTWPPREILDQKGSRYLVSAHPLAMPLDFIVERGVPSERFTLVDSLKVCYLVDHFLAERYREFFNLSADRREFVKWADAIFAFDHAFCGSLFPGQWREMPPVVDATDLSRMIAREQVRLNILARILSTFVDWVP